MTPASNLQLLSDGSSDRYLEYKHPAYENLTLDSRYNAGLVFIPVLRQHFREIKTGYWL